VNDRRTDHDGERRRFASRILPPYMRRSPKVAEVLPVLYLRGLSTGDFRDVLATLLGDDAAGLSATNIARLTNEWEAEYRIFQKRSLADRDCMSSEPFGQVRGQSISAFEDSPAISAFSSKFDAFLKGKYTMGADEMAGYKLFNGKGNCNSCHLDGLSTTLKAGQTDTGAPADTHPLFTCFGYANLGLPLNPRIALFYETKPDRFGFTPNQYGFGYRDLGLGTFLRSGYSSGPNPDSRWLKYAPTSDGQMQTSTARDVALTPAQCPTTEAGQTDKKGRPIPYFQKEFFHNGYIKSDIALNSEVFA
jgi:Transposase, Mutator family